jgi:type VI secretion system FHA domain protein
MELLLRALRLPDVDDRPSVLGRFGRAGGRIGRHPSCTLALARAERHVSRLHAEITWRDDTFTLTVASRINGVEIDERHLAPGESRALDGGERIGIGGYVFETAVRRVAAAIGHVDGVVPADLDWYRGVAGPASTHRTSPMANGADPALKDAATPEAFLVSAEPGIGPVALEDDAWADLLSMLEAERTSSAAAPPALDVEAGGLSPPAPGGPSTEVSAFAGFVASAGLAPEDLDDSQSEATLVLAGELLRRSIEGIHRLLERRGQTRRELHVADRTAIATRANNPLKHAGSAREAVRHLLDMRAHGSLLFMSPARAVSEAVDDIVAHEAAVVAGLRAALDGALRAFSPGEIEGRIRRAGALEGVLPALHKARLWDSFIALHAELAREADERFDRVTTEAFAQGYADRARAPRH